MRNFFLQFIINPLNLDLNPFNLLFRDKELEAEFSADFRDKKLILALLFTILSALMFYIFYLINDMVHSEWFIVMIILSILFWLTVHFKVISKFHYTALFSYSLIVVLSYNHRMLFYKATDTGGLAEYFLGLMLIVLAVNSFIRLKFVYAILMNVIFFVVFIIYSIIGVPILNLNPFFFSYSSIIFISNIIVISISIYNNEYIHRSAFIQHKIIRQQANELREAKENMEQKVIERTTELEQERSKKLKAIIEGQQIERHRIAQDLHDSLNIRLVVLKRSLEPILLNRNKPFLGDIDGIISQVREISHNLLPYSLKHFGLLKAIDDLCSRLTKEKKMEVVFSKIDINDESRWDPLIEAELFRIIQELVTNCLKHAQANKLLVELIAGENTLYLTVEDNGIGFELNNIKVAKFGLNNIETRIQLLGGSMSFDSRPGKGTTIMINIPIN